MNNDLFSNQLNISDEPLASRMRPVTLDSYIGQEKIIGKGRLLRRAIQADRLSSVIFYGPPGTGKTTLAKVIANHTKSNFLSLNAVLAGVQQIRDSIKTAEENKRLYQKKTILFVDEVHRWNKSQQDALLPWVENGTIILIGATTENPFFEVNKALVSRSRVFQLETLTEQHLLEIAHMAIKNKTKGYGKWIITFEDGALEHIVKTASGDARNLLNALELAIETTPEKWPPIENTEIKISMAVAEESIQKKVVLYDKDGDYHYDVISAFIKSIRGSDPDASLYWLARMIIAGEDPHFIFRRLLISACEDIGLAQPNALSVVTSATEAFDRVGLPEGRYHLAHATLFLATCPKSNSSMGFFDALQSVESENTKVPQHLQDPTRDAKHLGHGHGYIYPHAYKNHWVEQQYLPDELKGYIFYKPSNIGYEASIRTEVLNKREAQLARILEKESEKTINNIFSDNNSWEQRIADNRKEILETIREHIFTTININEYTRALIFNADNNLLIWNTMRIATESITCALCKSQKSKNILSEYAKTIENINEINIQVMPTKDFSINLFPENDFDAIISWNPAKTKSEFTHFFKTIQIYQNNNPQICFAVQTPYTGLRLSSFLEKTHINTKIPPSVIQKLTKSEHSFFSNPQNSYFNWSEKDIIEIATSYNLNLKQTKLTFKETRTITKTEINNWFSTSSEYLQEIKKTHTQDEINHIKTLCLQSCNTKAQFKTEILLFTNIKT